MGLASRLRSLLPDGPVLVDATVGGERLVARMRIGLLLVVLATACVPGLDPVQQRIGLGFSLPALALALLVYWAVTRHYRPWMGLASSAVDVTLVSAALASLAWAGQPHTALNSQVLFDVYFLSLVLASLRYDWRLTALAGGLAALEYAVLAAWVGSRFVLAAPRGAPDELGALSWAIQAARVVLLLGAAALTTAVVLRAQHLHSSRPPTA